MKSDEDDASVTDVQKFREYQEQYERDQMELLKQVQAFSPTQDKSLKFPNQGAGGGNIKVKQFIPPESHMQRTGERTGRVSFHEDTQLGPEIKQNDGQSGGVKISPPKNMLRKNVEVLGPMPQQRGIL